MSKFLEMTEKITEQLKRVQAKIGSRFSIYSTGPKNSDELLATCQLTNISEHDTLRIEPDERYRDYCAKWGKRMIRANTLVGPGKRITLPNRYVILYNHTNPSGRTNERWHFGDDMKR